MRLPSPLAALLVSAGILTAAPAAADLAPGTGRGNFYTPEDFVVPGDPAFFGAPGASATASGTVIRDGLSPGELDPTDNLFRATAEITSSVVLSEPGRTVLTYDFDFAPSLAGPSFFVFATISGFAGYEVDSKLVGVFDEVNGGSDEFFPGPSISRSDDGDVITIDFRVPDDMDEGRDVGFLPVLLDTDAPAARRTGDATVAIFLDTFNVTKTAAVPALLAPAPIPLPAGLPLLGMGLGALALARRRRT